MILLIDNYDSFVYNVYQLVGSIDPNIKVIRNDALSIEDIEALSPSHIIISPGPGYPRDAGVSIDLIKRLSGKIPILGICLGHQAIVEAFGGEIIHALELVHGKKRPVHILMDEERAESLCPLFHGLPEIIEVARYHSLAANTQKMPDELVVTALAPDQTIMAVHHKTAPVFGIQFHPESILTTVGETIMRNFLSQRA
ncbi:MAG TPA: aminodeoxychorismate/anthranilate synthase component II [Clostridiaceae bacterium]|jgi:anthranilate synthase component 2|nr:aminodeoxychorismate/anthranilate synthase component II [Clostridiaceae bacterium]